MENPIDLIVLIIFVTFLKFPSPFCTCNNQLQGWTAPPPACLFLDHFCVVVGFVDAVGSPVIILNKKKKQIQFFHNCNPIQDHIITLA